MTPRREVYEQELNEVEQQFAQHNLDKDMRRDSQEAARVVPKEIVRRAKAANLFLLAFFVALIGLLVFALGGF